MIDDSWSDEDRRRITWTCKDCGVTTDANLRDGTWHTCSGRATLPRGAQPAEQASYDDGPRWPPTPPDTGLSPADGPFTDQTLTVMASASQEQASGETSPTRGPLLALAVEFLNRNFSPWTFDGSEPVAEELEELLRSVRDA